MKIGLLLPRSSTHPLIAYNFMDGLNAYLKHAKIATEIDCVLAYIGFGTDKLLIQKEAEDLLLAHRVDLLVVFADHPVVSCLFPVVTALNKLLIIVNHGAKYPASWAATPGVIHHSLNNALNCWITGKQAAAENKTSVVVNSFYDGGYSISHALATSFLNNSGDILFNFVGKQYKAQFNAEPLISFLNTNPGVDSALSILSGELVPEFYQQLRAQLDNREFKLYASPVLLEESLAEEHLNTDTKITTSGYTSWFKALENAENQIYCSTFKKETSREPDSFGVLGWDTGLLLKTIMKIQAGQIIDAKSITAHPELQQIQGAKGKMHLHHYTKHYISAAHYIQINSKDNSTKGQDFTTDEVEVLFDELINFKIEGPSSEWLNTYLCS